MAEISREESIEVITKWIGCNEYDSKECLASICDDCKNNYEEDEFKDSLKKAISDMEKLEKIEHELYLINNAEFEIPNNAYTFLDRVEQIIKG